MPRRKTDVTWEQKIFALKGAEPDLSAEAIAHRFEEQAGGVGYWPAARTIRRILDEKWDSLTAAQRRQYALFRWPESMEDGSLPWEASAAGLELLRYWEYRPPVRLVKWFWRVTQAVPSANVLIRLLCAFQLAMEEALTTVQHRRGLEWFLAFQPWRSAEDSASYGRALQGPSCEPIPAFRAPDLEGIWGQFADADLERAFDIIRPGFGRAMLLHLKLPRAVEDLTVEEVVQLLSAKRWEQEGYSLEELLNLIYPGKGTRLDEVRRALSGPDLMSKIGHLTVKQAREHLAKERKAEAGNGETQSG